MSKLQGRIQTENFELKIKFQISCIRGVGVDKLAVWMEIFERPEAVSCLLY